MSMSIQVIRDFSAKARTDAALGSKLKACEKLRELLTLAHEPGPD
jgi:hypothetical protein